MPWVRLDDGFADHPKVENAGPLAGWLHVAALCYSARHLTDGRIPKSKARRLTDIPTPAKHIDALLSAGLWHEDGDDYVIHDYLDYQPSRAEVEKDREAARERMAKARRNKRRSSPEQPSNVPPNSERSSRNRRSDNPIPSRPDPSPNDARGQHVPALALVPEPDSAPPVPVQDVLPKTLVETRPSRYPSDFESWWALYPVKKGKDEALREFHRARGRATWKQLLDGLKASVAEWQAEGTEPRYIPRAAKWLSGGHWANERTEPAQPRPKSAAALDRVMGAS